jgi:magnesium transporter
MSGMLEKLLLPEIRELIQDRELAVLGEALSRWHPADLAELLGDLDDGERAVVLRVLGPTRAAESFAYLDLPVQEELLGYLPDEDSAQILNNMSPDDRTALLEDLPPETAQRYIALLSPQERAVAQSLLKYGEDSIGRVMTPDFIAVPRSWSVAQVLDYIRTHGKDSETLNVIYIVDEKRKLIDDIRARELLLAPLERPITELMDNQFIALNAAQDKQSAVEIFRKYDRTALPVVNDFGTLVGIVTIDDVLDIAEEEATRDIQQLGGQEALDEPYVDTPLLTMVRKRGSWLVFLFLGELLTATAMGFFEKEIAKAVVLALFVPLIISSGGNSGSQAATLIVRALALGEIGLRDWWFVMRREIASGMLLGTLLGSIGFVRIALWSAFSNIYGPHWLLVGLTVGLSLVGIVMWGTLSGSMLPFVLKRAGLDPATSSAPFVATLVDVTGLIIYFSVALVMLRGTLL